MRSINSHRTRGFSIVELIVAIVIIAILASIAIVGYSWMRNDAMDAKMAANASSVVKALKVKRTRTGNLRLRWDTRDRNDVLDQMYLKDLKDSVSLTVYLSDTCVPNISDVCHGSSWRKGLSPKDKVNVEIHSGVSLVYVIYWNHAEAKFTRIMVHNGGEISEKYNDSE